MTDTVTTLACPSCGSKLQIEGVDRFTCAHCGNDIDKTAAKVAIPRLIEKLGELDRKLESVMLSRMDSWIPMPRYESAWLVVTAISFFVSAANEIAWLFPLCLVSLFGLWKRREKAVWKMKQEATKDIKIEIKEKEAMLERTRKLLD